MLPKMAAGCLIAAFVTRLLPREVVARVVGGESGLLGLFIAMMMGAVLPGGPLTIYPVAGAFLLAGRRCRHRDRLHHRLEPARLQPRADLGAAVLRTRISSAGES